ncbi:MAG: A/G-specific adenine glycosylase [Pirellulales bacterium]|nr:A/G-specific adenine glycosylase [Pirellulales bacterium]
MQRRLKSWFGRAARALPWRQEPTAYRVWISEIMLQQTQVATVVPYFERFVARFPDVGTLAAAPEQAVLRHWEGLGYYRRARQLHRAAQQIVAEHAGEFPSDAEAVRRLPGIGRYTAGAILSIAFDRPEPILEANTLRVYSRLLGYRGDPRSTAGQKHLWKAAADWLPRRGAGAFNQALMELGATICTPRRPRCEECPVAALCRARALGLVEQIPPPARPPQIEQVHEVAVVIHRGRRVLVCQREPGERWAGLWDFVRIPWPEPFPAVPDAAVKRQLVAAIKQATGQKVRLGDTLTTLRHQVTRFRITLTVVEATAADPRDTARWLTLDELAHLPLSVTGRKIADLLGRDTNTKA